jgi:hypothetical protein
MKSQKLYIQVQTKFLNTIHNLRRLLYLKKNIFMVCPIRLPLFSLFLCLCKASIAYIHPGCGAGVRTHNLLIGSRLCLLYLCKADQRTYFYFLFFVILSELKILKLIILSPLYN